MAKEKQLFDDKAITFQRAVFIVCNLKRLIKRPKKDNDKYSIGSASHSRKRSGAENSTSGADLTTGDHQSTSLLEGVAAGLAGDGHAPQYKLRFRNPIRRAFTLPTIICGSFAGLGGGGGVGGGRPQHRHDSQCSPDCQLMEADHQQEPSDEQQHSETINAGRLRFWLDQTEPEVAQQPITAAATTKQRFVIHSPESPHAATPHSEGSPSSAQSRRASPVSFGGFEQCGPSTSGRRSRSGSRPGTSELIAQRPSSRPLNHNLSCLVTPIRRAPNSQLPVGPPPPPPPSRPSVVTSGRQTARHSADDRHGDKVAASTSARRTWCPIWALAMELLDKSQAQPRDSNAHAHLLGPPAPTNFLLAPLEPAEQCHPTSELDPSPASYLFDSEAAAAASSMAITKSRADSLDENDDDQDDDDDDDDDDDEQNDAQRRQSKANDDERQARMRMKRFSSSALCLNNNERTTINAPPGGGQKTCSGARKKQLALETGSGAKTLGSKLKSKLNNNNNNTDALERLATPDAAPNRRDKRSPSSVSSTSAGACSKSPGGGLLCAPEVADPIVQLARQRRPSVSNQGSVNVDQQALFSAVECNQLERAKTILDDGKVNVNSLNGDKLTCLDVAVLLRNVEMAKLLQRYQAKESSAYLSREGRENQLYALYMEARRLVEDLSRSIESISAAEQQQQQPMSNSSSFSGSGTGTGSAEQQQLMLATGSLLSSALFEEKQRQLAYWRRRLELFMQMRYGYQQLEVPNAPELVVLQVMGDTSLGVKIVHSLQLVTELLPLLSDTQTGSAQLPVAESTHSPLADLLQLASARNLTCAQGAKCSHWLMDEFQALRRSDQILKNPIQQPEVVSSQHLSRCRARTNEQHKQQERLAVFNYLLAQQLAILSQEQRQQHEQELLEQNHYFRSRKLRQQRDRKLASGAADNTVKDKVARASHQLLIAHQVESTDSAYDYLAAVANRQQQQQQQQQAATMLAVHPTCSLQLTTTSGQNKLPPLTSTCMTGSGGNTKIARRQQLDALRNQDHHQQQQQHTGGPPAPAYSLAYQLMSARKHATPVQHHQLPGGGGGGGLTSSPGEPPTGESVSLNRLARQSPATVLITKYKIEWSLNEHFEPVLNSMIIYNSNSYPIECQISDLINGQLYHVRVSSGNQKGFREPRCTTPACLAPSSWRQVTSNTAGKRKLKYDEQVFRKFTRLILLNKHILDEHQVSALQREQHNLLSNRASVGGTLLTGSAKPVNKSSLINMLLLDATLPSSRQQILGQLAPEVMGGAHRRKDTIRSDFELPPAVQLTTAAFNLTISAAASPRGSLYPIETPSASSTGSSGNLAGKLSSGSIGGVSTMISGGGGEDHQAPVEQPTTSLKVKKNFKNFFQSSAAKFHKLNNQNKRGLYLVTVLYHQQQQGQAHVTSGQKSAKLPAAGVNTGEQMCKIVVTNDDRLPVIEVMNELVSPSSVMGDFYWLLKINGTKWIDIKRLRQQLQRSHSSSTLHLRIKLLQAIEQMQLALNLEDIGRLFYKPIQAHDGSIIICTCRQVTGNLKLVSNLSIKWTQQHKLIPRHLRKISETISFQANQQRDFQQQSQVTSGPAIQHCHQSTPITTTKRHSSGAPKTGSADQVVQHHQQTAALAMGANGSGVAGQETSLNASDATGSGHMVQIMSANSPPENHNNNNKQQLCESCQQTRRCAMASGSSSSSLASNESQSTWSSSQFSLNSQYQATSGGGVAVQQAPQQQSTCTCSRSTSSATIGLVAQPNHTAGSNQLTTGNTNCGGQYAASAPTSQRNSTSARSSTSGQSYQIHPSHHYQSLSSAPGGGISGGSSSFSLSSGGGGGANLTETRLSAHVMMQQRQTQSQQLTGAMQPQKSSTYLMLASLSPYDLLLFHLSELIEFNQNSTVPLKRGLYLGFVQLQTTVESMRLLVPRKRPNMIPCTRIRDNAHVSREEWHLLKQFGALFGSCATTSGGACEPTGNAEPAEPKPSSSRSSDPSIWTNGSAVGQPQVSPDEDVRKQTGSELEQGNHLSTSSGFERGRAKSVSPADETRESAARARVHAAEAAKGATGSGLKPTTGQQQQQQQQQKHAHSDTDLQTGATGSSRPNSAGANSSDSNLYDRLEEDEHFRSTAQPTASEQSSPEMTFIRLIGDAAKRLLYELKSQLPKVYDCEVGVWKSAMASLNEQPNNRVYHLELIELSNQVTFVLLIPAPENVCPVTSHDKSNMLTNTDSDYMLLPLQIFETIHLHTYEPDLLGKYSRLSTILETDLIVAQHDHRQAFSSSELKTTKSRVTQLQDMVGVADEFWRQLRWLVDVVSFARDKSQALADSSTGCLRVGAIWRHFDSTMNSGGSCLTTTTIEPTSGALRAQEEPTGSGSPRLEVKRTLSAFNENGSARAAPQVSATSGRPRPPCLPQIQLPSGESLMTDSELDTQAKRARRKSSHKQVSRNLSAGAARPRGEKQANNEQSAGSEAIISNQRRHSQGERQAETRKRTSDSECHYQTKTTTPDETTTTTFARVGDQRSSRDAGSHRQYEPDESILKLDFGPNLIIDNHEPSSSLNCDDPDEEAIYAYHISLRDATRAAASARRKSSQHSVNVFLVEGEEKQTFSRWPVSSSSSLSIFEPRINNQDDDGTTTMIEFELAGKSELLLSSTSTSVTAYRNINNNSEKKSHEKTTTEQHERRARLNKSTNPFLTDSFDL